jgi:hypothetical protein
MKDSLRTMSFIKPFVYQFTLSTMNPMTTVPFLWVKGGDMYG